MENDKTNNLSSLLLSIKKGDELSFGDLWQMFLPSINNVIFKKFYYINNTQYQEALDVAQCELWFSALDYQLDSPFSFWTFSHRRITNKLNDYSYEMNDNPYSATTQRKMKKVWNKQNEFIALGKNHSDEELSKELKLSVKQVKLLKKKNIQFHTAPLDHINYWSLETPDRIYEQSDFKENVFIWLRDTLTPMQEFLILTSLDSLGWQFACSLLLMTKSQYFRSLYRIKSYLYKNRQALYGLESR